MSIRAHYVFPSHRYLFYIFQFDQSYSRFFISNYLAPPPVNFFLLSEEKF